MRELVIDLFAGGGGWSYGELLAGTHVDIAINHDPDAIAMHKVNHPETDHFTEDVFKIKPLECTKGRPVAHLHASPDCTHFSKAKGYKPVSRKRRSLANVVLVWAEQVKPRIITLENVEEFQTWGPCVKKIRKIRNTNPKFRRKWLRLIEWYPDPKRKGETFKSWKRKLERLGYKIEFQILSAADYGTPTIRKRLFMIARCDGQPVVWPSPTHGTGSNLLPYRTAAECIDWSIPCPSIFERKKPLAENTLRRIAKGIEKFVINTGNPFVVCCNHSGDGFRGQSINKPLCTITAAYDANGIVMPMLTKYHGGLAGEGRGQRLDKPLLVQDTQNRFGLVSAFLTKFYGTNIGSDMRQPVPTVTATGQHIGEVRAFLIKYYGCGTGQAVNRPLDTAVSKDKFGLVTVAGQQYQIADIGLRMLTPRELARAQGFPDSYILTGTKSCQVAKIGNSVCPPIAEAIVRANVKLLNLKTANAG